MRTAISSLDMFLFLSYTAEKNRPFPIIRGYNSNRLFVLTLATLLLTIKEKNILWMNLLEKAYLLLTQEK